MTMAISTQRMHKSICCICYRAGIAMAGAKCVVCAVVRSGWGEGTAAHLIALQNLGRLLISIFHACTLEAVRKTYANK